MKMAGNFHVMWTNPASPTCDKIEAERKMDAEPYKVAFTVAGNIDNKHDTGAAGDHTFSYRLRCKVGDAYSPYSNELSGNPVK